jgi:hypothetical protein
MKPLVESIRQNLAALKATAPLPKYRTSKDGRRHVPLDEFLRVAVGGDDVGARLHLYREFIRAGGLGPDAKARVDEIVAQERADGISEIGYPLTYHQFKAWLNAHRKEQHRTAAKTRWTQERRQKANSRKLKKALLT